jgi:hypothetical protein
VADFQAEANGRAIIPGIGTSYCDFAEIETRIEMARSLGTAGHALFSYSSLLSNSYFDELANGPYAETAVVPPLPPMVPVNSAAVNRLTQALDIAESKQSPQR